MTLLVLSVAALPAAGQALRGHPSAALVPPASLSAVEGFVSAVDGPVLTLLGSPLLRVDVSGATILAADPTGGAPAPITPGAFITATVEPAASPAAVPLPPPLVAKTVAVRPADTAVLSGEVQSVASDGFALLSRTILVDKETLFSGRGSGGPVQDLSDLRPGMQATAWVVAGPGGLTATKVVAFSEVVVPRLIHFRGVVKSIADGSWQIGEMTVAVTANTKIVGDPKVGDTVDVVAEVEDPPNPAMGMPSRIVARLIAKVELSPPPAPGRTITFDGTVRSMPAGGPIGFWKIDDRDVLVTGLTRISGNPKVGGLVTVTGYAMSIPLATGAAVRASSVPILATSIDASS